MKEQHVWLEQVELKNHLGFYGRVKIHVHLKNKEEKKKSHLSLNTQDVLVLKEGKKVQNRLINM